MKEDIKLIGDIDFFDIKVNVFHDINQEKGKVISSWQMRNPDSCYTGFMYMNNETGKCSYPDDAVIPVQTKRDLEMLPKFVIIGTEEISNNEMEKIMFHLHESFNAKNPTF